ncbi:MAG TPA: thiolase family protein, partial [Burkholderiales bacterium]|nr:thiolase family protein [Burkholderiales bacterium]
MNSLRGLKNKIAVAGVGTSAYGSFPDVSDYGLAAQAFKAAVADCGIDKRMIDGLLCCRVPYYVRMGEVLGLDPRWTMQMPGHGRMSGMGIIEAALALETGAADYVALVYSNIGRSRRVNYGGEESAGFWDPWGFTSPGAAHAMMFRMHMERYGTTTRQLAEIPVAFRSHALLHPDAVMRKPITIEDHETARPIVEPLRLLDYCLINDGAVCLIMTTVARARDLRKPPVQISGIGARDAFRRSAIA